MICLKCDSPSINWYIIADDDLLDGGCRFESVNTRIDASIETRIEHIAQQFLEQQRELKTNPLEADLQIPTELPVQPIEPQTNASLEIAEPIDTVVEGSPVDPETTP